MEKILEHQLRKTSVLMQAINVIKSLDDPTVEDHLNNLSSLLSKAKYLQEKRTNLLDQKRAVSEQYEDLMVQFNELASRTENITEIVFPENSQCNPFDNGFENDEKSCNSNFLLDVSPCPSEWMDGVLETPQPLERTKHKFNAPLPTIDYVSDQELNTVPGYMKGRITCETINFFIQKINTVLKKKYSIVNLKRKDVKRKDLIQYTTWKSQEEEYKMKGQMFFTGEDLMALENYKLDKSGDKMIQVLRHTNRLRQTTVTKKVIVYSLVK